MLRALAPCCVPCFAAPRSLPPRRPLCPCLCAAPLQTRSIASNANGGGRDKEHAQEKRDEWCSAAGGRFCELKAAFLVGRPPAEWEEIMSRPALGDAATTAALAQVAQQIARTPAQQLPDSRALTSPGTALGSSSNGNGSSNGGGGGTRPAVEPGGGGAARGRASASASSAEGAADNEIHEHTGGPPDAARAAAAVAAHVSANTAREGPLALAGRAGRALAPGAQ